MPHNSIYGFENLKLFNLTSILLLFFNSTSSLLLEYVATLRELLEQLAEETTQDGLPRVSKAKMNDYSEKVETITSRVADPLPNIQVSEDPLAVNSAREVLDADEETQFPSSPGLRRRFVAASNVENKNHEITHVDSSAPIKLDIAAKESIEKHRKL
ncbi:Membrane fusion protein Use1 [Euphorbia peplus]|nr:Membrane fusion protein Use1 [Euphorbia peplus]